MTPATSPSQKVIPAQLNFLAIYNPSLGQTDETTDDQILYYSSPRTRKNYQQRRRHSKSPPELSREEKNERLRHIGLAQGMVEFGRNFSAGKAVDAVESEKSRIILHELEAGWWLLASINLTRLPIAAKDSTPINTKVENDRSNIEYSSREVKPPALLLQDLLRAHSTFLLHHASSMSALFVRTRRSKFVSLIGRFWDAYLSTWNVMMHGNPIVNVYNGIKLAGSGELGVGVGEEDRGSGEREVLEGFFGRIEGLVDLVVSKFGDSEPDYNSEKVHKDTKARSWATPNQPWLGTGAEPTSEDGAIFLGVGALSRKSLCDITHWMEGLYSWGPNAYGVAENPTSARKSRNREVSFDVGEQNRFLTPHEQSSHSESTTRPTAEGPFQDSGETGTVFSSQVNDHTEHRGMETSVPRRQIISKDRRPPLHRSRSSQSSEHNLAPKSPKVGKIANYFKLGYGTHWTLGVNAHKTAVDLSDKSPDHERPPASLFETKGKLRPRMPDAVASSDSVFPPNDSAGHFLVGLMGDIEHDKAIDEDQGDGIADDGTDEFNQRTLLRTVTVELERAGDIRAEADLSFDLSMGDSRRRGSSIIGGSERTGTSATSYESQDRNKTKKVRVVVYVCRPFIFTFLFELRSDVLALQILYRSIHQQLSTLHRPLLLSTKNRLLRPDVTSTNAGEAKTPIYDLIWDPKQLTVMSSIPNIPEPFASQESAVKGDAWTRMEALNTHMQLLNTFNATRNDRSELERTCKTSRGWWVVWTRILDSDTSSMMSKSTSPYPGASTPQPRQERAAATAAADERSSARESGRAGTKGTSRSTSTRGQSELSGPAHPFLDVGIPSEVEALDKEIFLVRRASDYVGKTAGGFARASSSSDGGAGWGSGPARLAQGIGVDTKRYIEGLLSMGQ